MMPEPSGRGTDLGMSALFPYGLGAPSCTSMAWRISPRGGTASRRLGAMTRTTH